MGPPYKYFWLSEQVVVTYPAKDHRLKTEVEVAFPLHSKGSTAPQTFGPVLSM